MYIILRTIVLKNGFTKIIILDLIFFIILGQFL